MFGRVLVLKGAILVLIGEIGLYYRLHKRYKDKRWFPTFRLIYIFVVLYTILHFLNLIYLDEYWSIFPKPIQTLLFKLMYIWTLSIYAYSIFVLIYFTFLIIRYIFLKLHKRNLQNIEKREQESYSRKAFLYKTSLVFGTLFDSSPFVTSFALCSGMLFGSNEILIEHVPIKIQNLPEEFQGYRIIQISDIHIGKTIDEIYLNYCQDLIQKLKADILVSHHIFLVSRKKILHKLKNL